MDCDFFIMHLPDSKLYGVGVLPSVVYAVKLPEKSVKRQQGTVAKA